MNSVIHSDSGIIMMVALSLWVLVTTIFRNAKPHGSINTHYFNDTQRLNAAPVVGE